MSHFAIKLFWCTLYYDWRQKCLRNWVVTLCNKIIISVYFPTYLDYISASTRLMVTILSRLVSYGERPPSTKSHNFLTTKSSDHVTNEKYYFSTSPVATKLDREVACNGKILFTKSQNPMIESTNRVTWQIGNVISPLSRDICSLNLIRSQKLQR